MTTVNVTLSQNKAGAASRKSTYIKKLLEGKIDPRIVKGHIAVDPLLAAILTVEMVDHILTTGTKPAGLRSGTVVQIELND